MTTDVQFPVELVRRMEDQSIKNIICFTKDDNIQEDNVLLNYDSYVGKTWVRKGLNPMIFHSSFLIY